MEGLVLLILELILPLSLLAGAVVGVLAALFGALLEALLHLLPAAWRLTRWAASSLAARRVRRALLGAVAVLGFALILIQTVFFEPIVRRIAAAVQARAGIELSFARASGNLLSGRVVLHEGSARRSSDPTAIFDVTAREMEVDVRLLSLLTGTVSIESVRVAGARGTYTRVSDVERPPRKPFQADVLRLEDVEIAWTLRRPDHPDFQLPLRIDRLEARPFSARDASFSVLFRSNAAGTLGGAPFAIATEGDGDGRRTTWTAERVPVRLMADFLGEPFDWLSDGTADFKVTDAWRRGAKTEVDLHWTVVFRDPKAAVPDRITGFRRTAAEGMVALINRKPKELPLDFTLTLNGEGFMGSMSLEALELWNAVGDAVAAKLAESMGLKPETGKKGLEWIKQRFRPK
ncbi:MAG TPA: hypothetical protein VF950_14900 [Planctomycetota bacterium]